MVVGLFGGAFAASIAHAGAPDPPVDLVAVLVGEGLYGYGGSLQTALDTLVDDDLVDSAARAPQPDDADRADLLRFLAAGSMTAVVVQGAAYGPALTEVAIALPDEAFIWIPGDAPTDPPTTPAGLPNVATIYADVGPAATLVGELLEDGRLAEVERLGWTGSSEPSGDDGIFITSLIGAAGLNSGSVVLTSRLDDAPDDSAPIEDAFDVLLVSGRASSGLPAPLRIEIAGSLGDDSDSGADDARRIVVGFHYEVALAEILAGYEEGELGGSEYHLTLENGGLTLEATDRGDAAVLREALVDAGLVEPVDSSPPTTEVITEPDETPPADSEPEPPPTSPPTDPTSPRPGTTTSTVRSTLPPDTGGPDTTEPTEPTTTATTDDPGTTAAETTTTDPTIPTIPTVPTIPPATVPNPPDDTEAPAGFTEALLA